MTGPDLTVVVVIHNMRREAPRTLRSLSSTYQRGVAPERYEVIVVDNGSDTPLGEAAARSHGDNVRYELIADASPSPAPAMNRGAALARGRWLGLIIDGARLVTPGLISLALSVLEQAERSMVETVNFHLGPGAGSRWARQRFDRDAEDALLDRIEWPNDGYRLFEIASPAFSSKQGWHAPMTESNCMFMSVEAFRRHGGYDERFDLPGGGFVNLDFYERVLMDPALTPVRLAGEANFHQQHNGAATGLPEVRLALASRRWRRQYHRLRGRRYRRPDRVPELYGEPGEHASRWMSPGDR